MYPVNQVILGGDSMFNNFEDLDLQIQRMEAYKKKLQQLKSTQNVLSTPVWDAIDNEVASMPEEHRNKLFDSTEYSDLYVKIQALTQTELLNLVKGKIESSQEGKELLQSQLCLIKKLKTKIAEETSREMELFNRFKEYSRSHPDVTYDEFIKKGL
jgi:hypothetical protein